MKSEHCLWLLKESGPAVLQVCVRTRSPALQTLTWPRSLPGGENYSRGSRDWRSGWCPPPPPYLCNTSPDSWIFSPPVTSLFFFPSLLSPSRAQWSVGGNQSPSGSTWSSSDTHLLPRPCCVLRFLVLVSIKQYLFYILDKMDEWILNIFSWFASQQLHVHLTDHNVNRQKVLWNNLIGCYHFWTLS